MKKEIDSYLGSAVQMMFKGHLVYFVLKNASSLCFAPADPTRISKCDNPGNI